MSSPSRSWPARFCFMACILLVVLQWGMPHWLYAATLQGFQLEHTGDDTVAVTLQTDEPVQYQAQPYQGGYAVTLANTDVSKALLEQGLPVVMDDGARFVGRAVPVGTSQVRILLPNVAPNQYKLRVQQQTVAATRVTPPSLAKAPAPVAQRTELAPAGARTTSKSAPAALVSPAVVGLRDDSATRNSSASPLALTTIKPSSKGLPTTVQQAPAEKSSPVLVRTPRPAAPAVTAKSFEDLARQVVTASPALRPSQPAKRYVAVQKPEFTPPAPVRQDPIRLEPEPYREPTATPAPAAAMVSEDKRWSLSPAWSAPQASWDAALPNNAPLSGATATTEALSPALMALATAAEAEAQSIAPEDYIPFDRVDMEPLAAVETPTLSLLDMDWRMQQAIDDLEDRLQQAASVQANHVLWFWAGVALIGFSISLFLVLFAYRLWNQQAAQRDMAQPKPVLPFSTESVAMRPMLRYATIPKTIPFRAPLQQQLQPQSGISAVAVDRVSLQDLRRRTPWIGGQVEDRPPAPWAVRQGRLGRSAAAARRELASR